jgi:hypothetical protein
MKKDDDLAQFASTYRARTFMLDLANQHGPVGNGTRPGARMIFRKAWKAIGPSHPGEDDIIGEVTKESLILLSHFFPGGKTGESKEVRAGRARREFFRTVSDTVFPTGAPPA